MTYRRMTVAIAATLLAACAADETGPPPDDGDPNEPTWELAWADEFDGTAIDQATWTAEVMPDPFNQELQYYTGRINGDAGANAWVENGALIIEARREDFAHRHHTSARLITKGKREFRYGRFEARIRQPGEVGMWPAFWMLGGNIDAVGWPRCGEIDVMEGKGRLPRWTSGALHRGPDASSNRITSGSYELSSGSFHDEWHVFAIEWEPGQVRWEVDSIPFLGAAKVSGESSVYWPFDEGHSFFMILNLAVGGWFDSPYLPPDDMAPQRLYVDYVRVYRRSTN